MWLRSAPALVWLAAACTAPVDVGPPRGALDAGLGPGGGCEDVRCDAPGTTCVVEEGVARCGCVAGTREGEDGSCRADPCTPNPCPAAEGKGLCSASPDDDTFTCGCDDRFFDAQADGSCAPRSAPADLAGLVSARLLGETPRFEARLVVRAPDGRALAGATLHRIPPIDADASAMPDALPDAPLATSDPAGRIRLPDMDARAPTWMQVAKRGFLPATLSIDYANAGGTAERRVVLLPEPLPHLVDAARGGSVHAGPLRVHFPPRAFTSRADATLGGTIEVLLSYLDATAPESAAEGFAEPWVIDPEGRWQLAQGLVVTDLRVRTEEQAPARLAPTLGARVSVAFHGGSGLAEGEALGWHAWDPAARAWRETGRCTLRSREAGGLGCDVTLRHDGRFLLARRAESACITVTPRISLPAHLELTHWSMQLRSCLDTGSGLDCAPSMDNPQGAAAGVFDAGATANEGNLGSQCTLVHAPDRSGLVFVPMLSGVLHDHARGESVPFEHALTPLSLADLGARLSNARAWRAAPGPVCGDVTQCLALTPVVEWSAAPDFADEDGDGYLVARSDATPAPLLPDCDDQDPSTYPGAHEVACDGRTTRCGGPADLVSAPATLAQVQSLTAPSEAARAARWSELCQSGCALPAAEEVPGNAWDEDCDGYFADFDGDGAHALTPGAAAGQVDCDDRDPAASPAGVEVAGNARDEDCDGLALDADGDGAFATTRDALELSLALEPPYGLAAGGDCDDADPARGAGGVPGSESHLAHYFQTTLSGEVVRVDAYCDLLDEAGHFSMAALSALRDENCDGELSDLDGDGWTRPGQRGLGADRAYDCNDFDPRVVPERVFEVVDPPPGGFLPGATVHGFPVECRDAGSQANDEDAGVPDGGSHEGDAGDAGALTECGYWTYRCDPTPPPAAGDALCAAAPVPPRCDILGGVEATCLPPAAPDAPSLCAQPGWLDRLPPRPFAYGQHFGPCDGYGRLPACPRTSECVVLPAFTDAYRQALMSHASQALERSIDLTDVPADYLGVCLPHCEGVEP